MKIYFALNVIPWEKLSLSIPDPTKTDGSTLNVSATSSTERAGFIPVFWTEEQAKTATPEAQILEGEVEDDWHPNVAEFRPGNSE